MSSDNTFFSNQMQFINDHILRECGIKHHDNIVVKFSADTEYDATKSFDENLFKSVYFYTSPNGVLVPFASQYNKIPSTDADIKLCLEHFKGHIKKIYYQPAYEGTTLIVYNHDDKWYISTRRCIDAHESSWDPTAPSHYEIAEKLIDFSKLNKDYVYHYNLVSHDNRYIIDYTGIFGKNYVKLIPLMVVDKKTMQINYEETEKIEELKIYDHPENFIDQYPFIKNDVNKEDFTKGRMYMIIDDENNIFNINVQPDIYNKIYLEVGKAHRFGIVWHIINVMLFKHELSLKDSPYLKKAIEFNKDTYFSYKMMFNVIAVFLKDYYFIRKSPKYSCPELFNMIPACYKSELYNMHYDIYINGKTPINYYNTYKHIVNRPAHEMALILLDFPRILHTFNTYCTQCNYFETNVMKQLSQYFEPNMLLSYLNQIEALSENVCVKK